jgi:hypothetical protein
MLEGIIIKDIEDIEINISEESRSINLLNLSLFKHET